MTHYLIEFRFLGKSKSEIKQLSYHLDSKFHLNSKRPIPHISLAGPLSSNNERKLIQDFITICSCTPFCSFKINGYGFFEDSRVIYVHIDPSEKLKEFRHNIAKQLRSYCTLQKWDNDEDFSFHATLAMKLPPHKFLEIKKYIGTLQPQKYKHFMVRATLIKNQKILCDYDFLQHKVLTRYQALDKIQSEIDRELMQKFFSHSYM